MMTDQEILELVDQYGLVAVAEMFEVELFAFARAIAAKERETCAKVCDDLKPSKPQFDEGFYKACALCSHVIRERGEI